jgi:hypothetical protein
LRDALNYGCLYIGLIRENGFGETLLCLTLLLGPRPSVNFQRASAVSVAHQLLNNVYVFTVGDKKRGVGMPKRMPPDDFRNSSPQGGWSNDLL